MPPFYHLEAVSNVSFPCVFDYYGRVASFNYFDKDRNGILTKEELRLKLRSMVVHKFQTRNQALSGALKDDLYQVIDHVLDDVFQKADSDGDGGISIEEYVKAFSGESEATDFLKHM